MEAALASLRSSSVDEHEFLRLTKTALKIVQNLLNEPDNAKFREVRCGSKYVQKQGVSELLEAIGFELKAGGYVFVNTPGDSLKQIKHQITASRKTTGSVMGWDVPPSCIKFSLVQDKGKFGDIFIGRMNDQDVTVKVVRPDCDQQAKQAFDTELDILSKISHPNIVQLLAVTLTSEPISLILEHIPSCLLDVLHSRDLCEGELLRYGLQLASAMSYLHEKNILHCNLAARNLLLAADGQVRLSEFGLSYRATDAEPLYKLPPSSRHTLNVRWVPPETIKDLIFSKHSDIWSFGVVLYELLTGGSVPYATLSNTEVQAKVEEGLCLPQPQGCPEELYNVMTMCWSRQPSSRPCFSDLLKLHLEPLEAKLAAGDIKLSSTPVEEGDHKSLHSKLSKKLKVKEPSYQSVIGKGGGILRVYTGLVSPFHHRVVVVFSKKSSVSDVIATALAKCGKQDQEAKRHGMVLASGTSAGSPAHFLDPEDKIVSAKTGAPPTSMFILCVSMPGLAPQEIVDSIRQNPVYRSAFSLSTRGYLVCKEAGQGRRSWCVLDGSTLLCYREEEDEGVKEFESYLDFKDCTVELTSKGKSHIFKVTTPAGQYSFLATSKDDMLQWVESVSSSKTFDPSPLLLNASEGAVIHAGFMNCQEFACSTQPLYQRNLGTSADFAGTYTAIDYGKHWTILRSSGLIQCLVRGRPETLFNLIKCRRVHVNNPREMREGVDYCIEVHNLDSEFIMRADLPTEHSDWVLAIEEVLRKLGQAKLLQGHRKRESGYVALKRLLMMGSATGQQENGRNSQLYCLPRMFDDMEDVYNAPPPPPLSNCHQVLAPPNHSRSGPRSELLQSLLTSPKNKCLQSPTATEQDKENVLPLPPRNPPPLPPREDAPPLPPRTRPISNPTSLQRPNSTTSTNSEDPDEDYMIMQSTSSIPPSPSIPSSPSSFSITRSQSIPCSSPTYSSQPITIPNRRPSKKSALLRTDSESSSPTTHNPILGSSLSSLQEGMELVHVDMRKRQQQQSNSSSSTNLCRQNSTQSLNSSFSNSMLRHMSVSSIDSTPPLPPRNGEKSSGYCSPLLTPSPSAHRSSSMCLQRFGSMGRPSPRPAASYNISQSDGLTMAEARTLEFCRSQNGSGRTTMQAYNSKHSICRAESIPRSSYTSEGYESNHSSVEDLSQLPVGWERGYCQNTCKYFYFNSLTGVSRWSLQEVLMEQDCMPGAGWKVVTTENGQRYYYHEETRQTTWNIQDTLA